MASRRLTREILDDLPETDLRAVASRKDLRRLNLLMLQHRIMADMLVSHCSTPPRRLLEIGSGDGSFMLAVASRIARNWPAVEIVLLDRQSLVTRQRIDAFASLGWKATIAEHDIFEWTSSCASERFDAIAANLFLHHFEDSDLTLLFERMAPMAPVFVATEPLRTPFPLLMSRTLRVIGANDVTRHDAPASVRAGFRGRELGDLWPTAVPAIVQERRRGLFTHAFAAVAMERRP